MTDAEKTQLLNDLRRVENQLSPENLACDGERSRSEVKRIGAILRRRRAGLISQLGYTPTDKELYEL